MALNELPATPETSQQVVVATGRSSQRQQGGTAPSGSNNVAAAPTTYQLKTSSIIRLIHAWSPSYLLVNRASVARDHLANERTFLSYLRTSLSLVTVGVAIPQISRIPSSTSSASETQARLTTSVIIGELFVAMGLLFILTGCMRYFYTQALMVRGLFPAGRSLIAVTTLLLIGIIIGVFIVMLVLD